MTRRGFTRMLAAPAVAASAAPEGFPLLERIVVGGQPLDPRRPPRSLRTSLLGVMSPEPVSWQRIHAQPPPRDWAGEARAVKAPNGDFLVMFSGGERHYAGQDRKVNGMILYRSTDGGKTWRGPRVAWEVPYNQHGFVPLVPRGGRRLYAFGTEPVFSSIEDRENAHIGFRHSDDNGHTWSPVTLIRPSNDPDYRGMFVMRMCETSGGAWLLAPHTGMARNPRHTRLYVLRSEDRGQSWTLLPAARPDGWTEPSVRRMEEGRPIALGGGRVLLHIRTAEGHLWEARSADDGKTWSEPRATALIHPLAPPMTFPLTDGKTLAAFHHNRAAGGESHTPNGEDRSELWVSLSRDEGATWSEPRLVVANAAGGGRFGGFANTSVSYLDAVADGGVLHLILSHQFRQVLHGRLRERDIGKLPLRRELGGA